MDHIERRKDIDETLETIKNAWLQAPELRLMQLLVNAGVFGKMEFIDSAPFVRDPFHINDERICNMVDGWTCGEGLECPKQKIDWEAVKKAPLYIPAERVPIDSAKYIIYKGDRDFNGTILPVYFYIYIPYCLSELNTFGIDFVPHEYIPEERNTHLNGCTCYGDGIYAVDLEYASRNVANSD